MADVLTAPIAIQCNCGARMRVPAAKAGKRGKCPKCGAVLDIPAASEPEGPVSAEPVVTDDGRIKFACDSCGKSLKVPQEAAGRRVKCPKCSAAVTVPDPNAAASDEAGGEEDMFAGIASTAAPIMPLVAPPPPPMDDAPRKKSSGGGAGAVAVLGAAGAVGGAVAANPVLLCIVGSALGAAIGGAIWCAVAFYSHYESGWIAWGVGGLAGLGAVLGARDSGSFQGLVAMGMSVLGIIAGKFAVFYLVLQPVLAALNEPSEMTRDEVVEIIAAKAVDAEGISPDDEDKWDRAMAAQTSKARDEVAKLSDQQVQERGRELAGEFRDAVQSEMTNVFWQVMFRPLDILFFGLALFTAFRIGNGGFGGGED